MFHPETPRNSFTNLAGWKPALRHVVLLFTFVLLSGCGKFSSTQKTANEYVWLTRYDVKTLDPAAIQDWTTGKVLSYVYPSIGQLCDIKSVGYKDFFLKLKGAKFSNGDPVTIKDLEFTLERCLKPSVQSSVGNQFAAEILGSKEFIEGKSQSLAGLENNKDDQLSITLSQPDQAFAAKLKNTAFGVLNHKVVALDKPLTTNVAGAGAGNWTLESFAAGREWVLKRPGTGEKLKFRYVGDSATRRSLFDKGGADYAMFGAHEAGVVKGHPNLDKGGPITLVYLQFNPKTKPELNAATRYMIRSLVRGHTDFPMILNGTVTPAYSFLDLSGLKPTPESNVPPMSSISKPHLEITYAEIGMQNPSVEAIVTTLHNSGLEAQGRAMPSGAMLEKNARGEIPILFTGWQPDFDGPLNTIPMLFHSKSSENHSGYRNPRVDALIGMAQRGEHTAYNIQKAYQLIEADSPGAPLYIQRDLVLKRREPPAP